MSIFSPPKAPQFLPPPRAPVALPTKSDPRVGEAAKRDQQLAALAAGRNSTIATSGLGLTSPAKSSAKKTILGA